MKIKLSMILEEICTFWVIIIDEHIVLHAPDAITLQRLIVLPRN